MRNVKLFIAASLDGFIAGPNDEIDWLFTDADYGITAFTASVDTTLMGSKTYDVILTFAEFPYADKQNFVFTRNKNRQNDQYATFIREDIPAFVRNLKQESGKVIWLIGGGEINTMLLNAGLIDEIILSIHPVVLGQGKPLFAGNPSLTWFKTVNTEQFESGLVQLTLVKGQEN